MSMSPQSSILCNIPLTILEDIALQTAVLDPLGPPSHLVPLLLTCRQINTVLHFSTCRDLYARIFRSKFDYRAAFRRMGARATFSSNIATQLQVYCVALKRIRQADIYSDFLVDDLWTAFFLCTENDGKNEAQLRWAGLASFIDRLVRTRLWEDREDSSGWPAESNHNALAIWLMWFTTDYATLTAQSPEQRRELMDLIRPYVLTALRYPSFHAPDNHFDFPLPHELQDAFPFTLITPHGFYPLYRQPEQLIERFTHYNLPLAISPPLIAQGAKLLYMTLSEVLPLSIPPTIPRDRAHAIELGNNGVSPTQADFIEANAHKSVKLLEPGDWDWRSQLNEDDGKLEDDGVWRKGLRGKSALWDNDWHRLTGCINPWRTPELKGVVYTYGAMDGLWQGRLLIPEVNQYFALVTSTHFPTNFSDQNPRLITVPVYMCLREHHCINPQFPTLPGGARDGFDDGVRNAWFPTMRLREANGIVRIDDETNGLTTHYETYVEGRPNSHDEETCESCLRQRVEEEQRMLLRREVEARMEVEVADANTEADGTDAEGPVSSAAYGAHSSPRSSRIPMPPVPGPRTGSPTPMHPMVEDPEVASFRQEATTALGRDVDTVLHSTLGRPASPEDEDMDDDDARSVSSGTSAHESVEEYMLHTCNGIVDIILTGETLPRHGQAWHHFRFYGRVRKWDGLVAIVRVPVQYPELGIFIFRGYQVGNMNFVGSWRAWTSSTKSIPLEGPFVMSKA